MYSKRNIASTKKKRFGIMLSRLFITDLWSPAGKGLVSWLLFVMPNFPMWYTGSGVVIDLTDF